MEGIFEHLNLEELKNTPIGSIEQEQPEEDPETPQEEEDQKNLENKNEENEEINNEQENNEEEEEIDETPSTDEPPSSPYKTLALALKEEGVFLKDEELEKIKTAKDLVDVVKNAISESEYSDLNEKQKKYLTALKNGVPEKDVTEILKAEETLENISEDQVSSSEELQEAILLQKYLTKGMEQDAARELVEVKKEKGILEDEAKEALNFLKEEAKEAINRRIERSKEEKKKREEEIKAKLEELKTKVLKTEEIIPGIKIPAKFREKLFDTMTKAVDHDEQGRPLNALGAARKKDPERIEMILNYLYLQTDGFKDFKGLKTPIKNSAIDELEKVAQKSSEIYSSNPKNIKSSELKGILKAVEEITKK